MRSSETMLEQKVVNINDFSNRKQEVEDKALNSVLETLEKAKKEFMEYNSLKNKEYVHTDVHKPFLSMQTGGGQAVWNSDQKRIIDSLRDDSLVQRLYFYKDGTVDHFIVTSIIYDSDTMMYFVNFYWKLFDQNPEYEFEIDSFANDEVSFHTLPNGAVKCFVKD